MRRTSSKLYREAAERIDTGEIYYSCMAIREAAEGYFLDFWNVPPVKRYLAAFAPKGDSGLLSVRIENAKRRPERKKQLRVMMLLFMAEAWRDL